MSLSDWTPEAETRLRDGAWKITGESCDWKGTPSECKPGKHRCGPCSLVDQIVWFGTQIEKRALRRIQELKEEVHRLKYADPQQYERRITALIAESEHNLRLAEQAEARLARAERLILAWADEDPDLQGPTDALEAEANCIRAAQDASPEPEK